MNDVFSSSSRRKLRPQDPSAAPSLLAACDSNGTVRAKCRPWGWYVPFGTPFGITTHQHQDNNRQSSIHVTSCGIQSVRGNTARDPQASRLKVSTPCNRTSQALRDVMGLAACVDFGAYRTEVQWCVDNLPARPSIRYRLCLDSCNCTSRSIHNMWLYQPTQTADVVAEHPSNNTFPRRREISKAASIILSEPQIHSIRATRTAYINANSSLLAE